jgi:hypothetical protein
VQPKLCQQRPHCHQICCLLMQLLCLLRRLAAERCNLLLFVLQLSILLCKLLLQIFDCLASLLELLL